VLALRLKLSNNFFALTEFTDGVNDEPKGYSNLVPIYLSQSLVQPGDWWPNGRTRPNLPQSQGRLVCRGICRSCLKARLGRIITDRHLLTGLAIRRRGCLGYKDVELANRLTSPTAACLRPHVTTLLPSHPLLSQTCALFLSISERPTTSCPLSKAGTPWVSACAVFPHTFSQY
jgi:hypothetical protein